MSLASSLVAVTERHYRTHIGDLVATHTDMVAKGREAVARLRNDPSAEDITFADSVWGGEHTATIQRALRSKDESVVACAFYEPVVALLVRVHREAFERSVGAATAELLVGSGRPFPPGSADAIGRADGRCMAVLKEFTDPHSWTALYRWAWQEYGPSSETVLELRAVA